MKLIELKPHKHQYDFLNTPARYSAIISGVGGGKTYAGCLKSLDIMQAYPNSLGAIVAPTYKMLNDVTLRTFLELCPREWIRSYHKTENKIKLVNNSEAIFRSTEDPERLRGPNLSWFYIDEAALASKLTWKIMIGRLRKDPEIGFITSTPKGFNWIYDEFVKKPRSNYFYISYATSDNPYLSQEYLDSLLENYSGAFLKQEFYGEFVAFEGLVYPDFNRELHVVNNDKLPLFKEYIGACDFGFTNPSVFLVIGIDNDERMYVLEEFYQKGVSQETYCNIAKNYHKKYSFSDVYCDPSSPDYISALNSVGVPSRGIKRTVMEGISKVSERLIKKKDEKARLYVHERCINTLMEFSQYRYPEFDIEKPIKENPIKLFDHALDALSYAIFGYSNRVDFAIIGELGDAFS